MEEWGNTGYKSIERAGAGVALGKERKAGRPSELQASCRSEMKEAKNMKMKGVRVG